MPERRGPRPDRPAQSARHRPADAGALALDIAAELAALRPGTTAQARSVRRHFSRQLRDSPARLVLSVAVQLAKRGDTERFVAYELVGAHPTARRRLSAPVLRRLAYRLASWGAVDCFACLLAGPAWRAGQVPASLVHRWARSPDRWWRRAALVSTVPLNSRARGGGGDAPRTLRICRLLVSDRDDMVVKAMSWALRELAKRDPAAVRTFLAAHDGSLAPRVRREVLNKLRTGLKSGRPRAGRSSS